MRISAEDIQAARFGSPFDAEFSSPAIRATADNIAKGVPGIQVWAFLLNLTQDYLQNQCIPQDEQDQIFRTALYTRYQPTDVQLETIVEQVFHPRPGNIAETDEFLLLLTLATDKLHAMGFSKDFAAKCLKEGVSQLVSLSAADNLVALEK